MDYILFQLIVPLIIIFVIIICFIPIIPRHLLIFFIFIFKY